MPLTKILNQNNPKNASILGWDVDVTSATEYYAFGMAKPGRTFVASVRISIVMGSEVKKRTMKSQVMETLIQQSIGSMIVGWVGDGI